MTQSDTEFSAGLFAIALSPERLYEFAEFFNDLSNTPDESKRKEVVLNKQHVLQAIQVSELFIEKEISKAKSLRQSIHRANHPMLAVNAAGNIIETNSLANEYFGLTPRSVSFLKCFSEVSRKKLRIYLKNKRDRNRTEAPHFIDLIELEDHQSDCLFFVCISPWKLDDDECFLIQAINIKWPNHMTPVLKRAFNLTSSEIEVFRLLSDGQSVSEVATQRQTSIATVRTQIRQIYAKTGTKNQLQFIRLAISLSALSFDEEITGLPTNNLDTSFPKAEHWNLLKLPDGRSLDYAVFGNIKGRACLFFHNEFIGDVWPEELTNYAIKRGLKIILPARPYYRRSSGYPKGVNHAEQASKDILCLLDALEISKVSILSQTLGGRFALQFAHMFEDRVQSLCTLSPMLPFSNENQQNSMPPLHRFISSLALKTPWMMEFIARIGYAFYLKEGSAAFLYKTYSSAPVDTTTLSNPGHMASLSRGLKFGTHHGHKAYAADFKHLPKNPSEMMLNLSCPMTIIIGEKDMNTREERAQSLIESGIKMKVVIAPDGGELLVFTHPKLIIDTFLES